MLRNRVHAGEILADKLACYMDIECIILGIPRGGTVVASIVAERLKKPMDIMVSRKIGAPFNNEVAIGAVSQDGVCFLNEKLIDYYNISRGYIKKEARVQEEEIRRRLKEYRGTDEFPDVTGKTVILVDDGIATGFTIIAAVNSLKNHHAGRIVIAAAVASEEAVTILQKHADDVIWAEMPYQFISVGSSYLQFNQNSDEEIIDLFKQYGIKRQI